MSPTRVPDDHLDAALRRLDAAPSAPLDERAQARGDAALERALAGGSTPAARAGDDRLVPRQSHTGRRAALVAVAAGVAAIGIIGSQTLGGSETAYASSWTPTPTAASDADVAAAEEVCADSAPPGSAEGGGALQTRLAERRGDLVLLGMDDGTSEPAVLSCIVGLPPGGDAEPVGAAGGGTVRPVGAAIADASIYQRSVPGDELSIIDGLVGDQVQAVTIHTADGLEVQATVTGGHYAAWWPGLAMREDSGPSSDGSLEGCAGDCGGYRLVVDYTLDVTLEDGSVTRGIRAQDLGLGGLALGGDEAGS